MPVRVTFQGKLPERMLNVIWWGVPCHPQDLVVVNLHTQLVCIPSPTSSNSFSTHQSSKPLLPSPLPNLNSVPNGNPNSNLIPLLRPSFPPNTAFHHPTHNPLHLNHTKVPQFSAKFCCSKWDHHVNTLPWESRTLIPLPQPFSSPHHTLFHHWTPWPLWESESHQISRIPCKFYCKNWNPPIQPYSSITQNLNPSP